MQQWAAEHPWPKTHVESMSILSDEHEAVVLRCLPQGAGMESDEGIAFCTVGMLHTNGGGYLSLPTKPILLDGTFKIHYGGWVLLICGTATLRCFSCTHSLPFV